MKVQALFCLLFISVFATQSCKNRAPRSTFPVLDKKEKDDDLGPPSEQQINEAIDFVAADNSYYDEIKAIEESMKMPSPEQLPPLKGTSWFSPRNFLAVGVVAVLGFLFRKKIRSLFRKNPTDVAPANVIDDAAKRASTSFGVTPSVGRFMRGISDAPSLRSLGSKSDILDVKYSPAGREFLTDLASSLQAAKKRNPGLDLEAIRLEVLLSVDNGVPFSTSRLSNLLGLSPSEANALVEKAATAKRVFASPEETRRAFQMIHKETAEATITLRRQLRSQGFDAESLKRLTQSKTPEFRSAMAPTKVHGQISDLKAALKNAPDDVPDDVFLRFQELFRPDAANDTLLVLKGEGRGGAQGVAFLQEQLAAIGGTRKKTDLMEALKKFELDLLPSSHNAVQASYIKSIRSSYEYGSMMKKHRDNPQELSKALDRLAGEEEANAIADIFRVLQVGGDDALSLTPAQFAAAGVNLGAVQKRTAGVIPENWISPDIVEGANEEVAHAVGLLQRIFGKK
jgi:hypothetical protein